MKRIFLLSIFTCFFSVTLLAQNILNGDFENWTNGNPDNWYADNLTSVYIPITQSTAWYTGSYSVMGTVVDYLGVPIVPLLVSGVSQQGFTISQRFKTISGYYQFSPVQGDRFNGDFVLFKGSTPIANASFEISASASSWTLFSLDFDYFSASTDVPDICKLYFVINGPDNTSGFHIGSYFLLDDVLLSGTATSVNDKNIIPAKFSLEQNYPNPFNPSTKIQYNLPENSFVNLRVYNAIGTEVASLVNGVIPAGSHEVVFDASRLNSGIYFYTLKTGNNFVQTRKMILMK